MKQSAQVIRVLAIVLLANLAVAAAELVYAYWSGALVVSTDALHSAVDASGNVIALLAIFAARRPPDEKHPYGHGKFEALGGMIIGVLIAGGAVSIGQRAIASLTDAAPSVRMSNHGLVMLAATLVVNIAVAVLEARAAKRLRSPILHADAAHTFSDVLVKVAVIGAHLATTNGYPLADAVGAIVLLVVLLWVAWRIISRNVSSLIDSVALDPAQIRAIVASIPETYGCHRIRSRGGAKVAVDLHLLVAPDATVRHGHAIAHQAEAAIRARWTEVGDVTIHVEPRDDGHETIRD